jgi:hypothetical protein
MFYETFNTAAEASEFQTDMRKQGFLCYTVEYNIQRYEVRYWML